MENSTINDYEKSFSEEALSDLNETEVSSRSEIEKISNGLENFGVEEESGPDLFNSESEDLFSSENGEESSEGDDLEIPAFLRRQKN